eukprot:CAMPEP_0119124402 /NCGR_PEP_ID=MMETSP1310-20130426/4040_1 /TAXON_ID=464262 /ORGANISM="Genus nov. species nov., Strain RCC2339" /LENGTH=777 /DNA_ID=CAMNT_0007114351 /DNA_START=86 /DNA_END=2416 /DNA_ORIENTATION=+
MAQTTREGPTEKVRPEFEKGYVLQNKYMVTSKIALGGSCSVFCAVSLERSSSAPVALKVISKRNKDIEWQWQKEIEALRTLRHDNIMKLVEVLEDADNVYIVLEYASGGTMHQLIVRRGTNLPEDEVRLYFNQVLSALNFAHAEGWVHRDIKLDNILLLSQDSSKVVLCDWGFATRWDPRRSQTRNCGTTHTLPPEMCRGESYVGPECDVWSLGVVLYMMAVARFPFCGENRLSTYKCIINGVYKQPSFLSNALCHLISIMLEIKPEKRATIWEVAHHPWVRNEQFKGLRPSDMMWFEDTNTCSSDFDSTLNTNSSASTKTLERGNYYSTNLSTAGKRTRASFSSMRAQRTVSTTSIMTKAFSSHAVEDDDVKELWNEEKQNDFGRDAEVLHPRKASGHVPRSSSLGTSMNLYRKAVTQGDESKPMLDIFEFIIESPTVGRRSDKGDVAAVSDSSGEKPPSGEDGEGGSAYGVSPGKVDPKPAVKGDGKKKGKRKGLPKRRKRKTLGDPTDEGGAPEIPGMIQGNDLLLYQLFRRFNVRRPKDRAEGDFGEMSTAGMERPARGSSYTAFPGQPAKGKRSRRSRPSSPTKLVSPTNRSRSGVVSPVSFLKSSSVLSAPKKGSKDPVSPGPSRSRAGSVITPGRTGGNMDQPPSPRSGGTPVPSKRSSSRPSSRHGRRGQIGSINFPELDESRANHAVDEDMLRAEMDVYKTIPHLLNYTDLVVVRERGSTYRPLDYKEPVAVPVDDIYSDSYQESKKENWAEVVRSLSTHGPGIIRKR